MKATREKGGGLPMEGTRQDSGERWLLAVGMVYLISALVGSRIPLVRHGGSPTHFREALTEAPCDSALALDLLIVKDTSPSMSRLNARAAVAMEALVAALPAETDLRVAVLSADGVQRSSGGRVPGGERLWILRSDSLSRKELLSALRARLSLDPGAVDRDRDGNEGGERGLAALNRALDPDRLQALRGGGFFRGTALAVYFVSGKKDLCSPGPEGLVTTPAEYDASCVHGSEEVSARLLAEKLRRLQGPRPLYAGGLLFTQPGAVFPHPGLSVGYGYLELIELLRGNATDLGGEDLERNLASLGRQLGRDAQRTLCPKPERGLASGAEEVYGPGEPGGTPCVRDSGCGLLGA
jgi:hypothetical protein